MTLSQEMLSSTMMYPEMTSIDLGFGPMARDFRGQNSFEDEVENIYFSDVATGVETQQLTQQLVPTQTTTSMMNMEDLGLVSANPEDVTGQTLAIKKEQELVEANFDISELLDTPMVTKIEQEDTDDVIQEMEEFLGTFENSTQFEIIDEPMSEATNMDDNVAENLASELLSMEQQKVLDTLNTKCPFETEIPSNTDGRLTKEQLTQAEELLDELLGQPQQQQPTTDILETAVASENLQDSGFFDEDTDPPKVYNIAGLSEIKTEDGTVIIVVQPAEVVENTAATVTTQQLTSEEDEDSDWTPEEPINRRKPGRKPAERRQLTDKVSKRGCKTVSDRKQRKKLQNVEAARRYRDKKKNEQQLVETEEQKLATKNKALKSKLSDVKNEMQTLKKLMIELGLLKVVKK